MSTLPDVDAVAICTPPPARYAIAKAALAAGKHVMLEKPPTATLSELADLTLDAEMRGLVLFTTWHSQYNRAVAIARKHSGDRARRRPRHRVEGRRPPLASRPGMDLAARRLWRVRSRASMRLSIA